MTDTVDVELSPTDVLDLLPPYPVVLVTTRTNVITVNQIMYFTFAPLRIGIGIAHSRYTYRLLQREREFVINVPDASLIQAVKTCGSLSGRDGDKFSRAGLDAVPSKVVGAIGIRQCGAQIECVVTREIAFEHRDWFVGEVVSARKRPGHDGVSALMCGRRHYAVLGSTIASR